MGFLENIPITPAQQLLPARSALNDTISPESCIGMAR